ncbi:40S ribosomal protein S28 [Verticillium dahliae VDG1]|nr:40S ribosomal protein S28 [Verticillium dahliae VDG1]
MKPVHPEYPAGPGKYPGQCHGGKYPDGNTCHGEPRYPDGCVDSKYPDGRECHPLYPVYPADCHEGKYADGRECHSAYPEYPAECKYALYPDGKPCEPIHPEYPAECHGGKYPDGRDCLPVYPNVPPHGPEVPEKPVCDGPDCGKPQPPPYNNKPVNGAASLQQGLLCAGMAIAAVATVFGAAGW